MDIISYNKAKKALDGLNSTNEQLAQKPDKSYVDEKVSQVADGAPKISALTLTELNSNYPNGSVDNAVVIENADGTPNGHIYTWSGTLWVTTGILYQAAGIPDNSINMDKVTFSVTGTNLYNPNEKVVDVYISNSSGNELVNTSFEATGFIKIKANTDYTINILRHLAFYDDTRQYISGKPDSTAVSVYTFKSPENARYVRFSWGKSDLGTLGSGLNQQINEGVTLLPFTPFRRIISKDYVEKHPITSEDIPDLPIEKLNFIERKSNLFDKNAVTLDHYVSTTSGNLTSATGFVSSDFIPISPTTFYIVKHLRRYAFYDANKGFISGRPETTSINNLVAESPANASFIRFSWYLPAGDGTTLNNQQMNQGTELLPYSDFGYQIPSAYLELSQENSSGVSINIPSEIYAVVGNEINIYFENPLNVPLKDYHIDVTCSIGKHLAERWTATPTTTGIYPITITVYKNFEPVSQTTSNIIVKDASVGTGVTKDALIMGDSTVNQDWMILRAKELLTADPLTVNFLGTRGGYDAKHHEGRGGWTASMYRTNTTYNGAPNPFFNPSTNDFDFSYYMTEQGFTGLNYFGFCSGINDTINFKTDADLLDAIPNILTDFDFIINSVHSYDANINVGVFVTIPPNESQDAFGEMYNNGYNQWRYKRNNALWIEKLVEHFDNRQSENIYLIPDNNNIDAVNGFRDPIHPNEEIGDVQRGNTLYYWFKSFEVSA